MKKTDIALIIIIVSISAGLSYWIASATIGKSNDKSIIIKTIDPITVDDESFKVDKRVFSEGAINPTVEAIIAGDNLSSPTDGDKFTLPDLSGSNGG